MAHKTKRQRKFEEHKQPNWLAVNARQRHTAGQMGDNRKEESRRKCRGKVNGQD